MALSSFQFFTLKVECRESSLCGFLSSRQSFKSSSRHCGYHSWIFLYSCLDWATTCRYFGRRYLRVSKSSDTFPYTLSKKSCESTFSNLLGSYFPSFVLFFSYILPFCLIFLSELLWVKGRFLERTRQLAADGRHRTPLRTTIIFLDYLPNN